MSVEATDRQDKLNRFFNSVLQDDTKINSARQGNLFIEAICSQKDIAVLADKLVRYPKGLIGLQRCVRQDLSLDFINGPATQLLGTLSDPSLAAVDSGSVLRKILQHLLRPSFFWSICIENLKSGLLNPEATRTVAWLLSETLRLVPTDDDDPYLAAACDQDVLKVILASDSVEIRGFGHQIAHRAKLRSNATALSAYTEGPGGRHDNDSQVIKDIQIIPTYDEISSEQPAFLRTASEVFDCSDTEDRYSIYIDNMFRVLRDDMVHTFKEKCDARQETQPLRKDLIVSSTVLSGIEYDNTNEVPPWRRQPWSMCFKAPAPLPALKKMTIPERKAFLSNVQGYGYRILRHGTFVAINVQGRNIGFAYTNRNVDKLSLDLAEVLLRVDEASVGNVLESAAAGARFDVIQINVSVFAYEPFLRKLQKIGNLHFVDHLLGEGGSLEITEGDKRIQNLIVSIKSNRGADISDILQTQKAITLDASQCEALLSGLSNRISLIQGPPGTGKSFIGALLARALHDNLSGTILVICFTNHALDQFTEDLMDIGIPESSIVRLGSKSSFRTESLLLRKQQSTRKLPSHLWRTVLNAGHEMANFGRKLVQSFRNLQSPITTKELFDYLEFLDDDQFYEGLRVSADQNGMVMIAGKGRMAGPRYLLDRWLKGDSDAGAFAHSPQTNNSSIWKIPYDARRSLYRGWTKDIRRQFLQDIKEAGEAYNRYQQLAQKILRSQDAEVLEKKRIIACTSTYAAMSSDLLSRIRPETVLLEEAGELLEAHVLTALGSCTERLIMIGDHKQLRPKVANYSLTVEAGNGYDLNRSLFERLLLRGFPHVTLSKQHRMRPEISCLVRHLTYPMLQDASSTLDRLAIRGLQQNVVFVDHREPEIALDKIMERHSSGSSKQNPYEAMLALRYVRYLAQQGYGSEDLVVLTPYLGQLRLLQETLSKENDPVLNDLDSHDLYNAGLLSSRAPKSKGRQIHLSSIDNYQGEEKKIVIVSLTRSNSTGDIGFMSEPERLNVLLSRARDGLIVIGNLSTFTSAKKGSKMWNSLREYIKELGYIWQGLPIVCQSHPLVKNTVIRPEDFLSLCPDGGCSQPCPETLACGQHKCPSKCHILVDHSKLVCNEVVKSTCPQGHVQSWRCQSKPISGCITCNKLDEKRKRVAQAKLVEIQTQEADQRKHTQELEDLEEDYTLIKQKIANKSLKEDQKRAIEAKKRDVEKAKQQLGKITEKFHLSSTKTNGMKEESNTSTTNQQQFIDDKSRVLQFPLESSEVLDESNAQKEWTRQKQVEGQSNEAIDELMNMVGLEQVKQHVLDFKGQIELKKRQGVDMSGERFHVSFLGNPGTGKTTVARLWARLLNSLEVIQGDALEESTGAKLATGGVPQAQKHIDVLVKANGGVLFVDEAYHLTSGTNAGGKQVLDFLLAELENRRDKVVFIFAGYKQPMESFFGHNPGIPSRIPYTFDFKDYSKSDFLKMLQKLFKRRFKNDARVEGGLEGLYMRIVATRLWRQSGREGFGNMRDLENVFGRICTRQANRIGSERRQGKVQDDFLFTKDDLIGPEPSNAVFQSPAWSKLQDMIGLQAVKENVKTLASILKKNYHRELDEVEPIRISLNKVFLGSPGTGKTVVAKLYGRLLADIGLLSNGDVVEKTPSDFVGSVIGASEQATSLILESAKGKVLVIDEAYMLDPSRGTEGGSNAADPYRTAVIDTIVSKVHNVPGDDCCVLLLGYREKIETMFQNANEGLSRRFPLDDAFNFEDFNDEELQQILKQKLAFQNLSATVEGEKVAMEELSRARTLLNFGNAGAVENLITRAKVNRQKRTEAENDGTFELDAFDFDPDHARAASAGTRLDELFKDTVGSEDIVAQLRQYQSIAANVKAAELPVKDHVPFNFIFKGPPGTGKTTTARKIGQVYWSMGLLQRVEVLECTVSDLVGQYVGQTGPKTKKQFEKALGKVLFIDEAYRLAEGHFATEAVNEITDLLTKPKFKGKLVVVLAGYEDGMNELMSVNPGLESRFAEKITFNPFTPKQCMELFSARLQQNKLSCPSFDDFESAEAREMAAVFSQLSRLKSWGNARDVENMSQVAMRYVYGQTPEPGKVHSKVPHQYIMDLLEKALDEKLQVENHSNIKVVTQRSSFNPPRQPQNVESSRPPALKTLIQDTKEAVPIPEELAEQQDPSDGRDVGVSDVDWAQLQIDSVAAVEREREDAMKLQALHEQVANANHSFQAADDEFHKRNEAKQSEEDHEAANDNSDSEDEEAIRARRKLLEELEAARLRRLGLMRQREIMENKLKEEKERQEKERKKEAKAQKKLKEMGVCCMGFRWIRQAAGYRCAGGSHYVSNFELGLNENTMV